MKRTYAMLALAATLSLVACGPVDSHRATMMAYDDDDGPRHPTGYVTSPVARSHTSTVTTTRKNGLLGTRTVTRTSTWSSPTRSYRSSFRSRR